MVSRSPAYVPKAVLAGDKLCVCYFTGAEEAAAATDAGAAGPEHRGWATQGLGAWAGLGSHRPRLGDAQARSSEQNQAGPSQDRARGYDADSETDGNELHGPPSHKPDADKPVTDGADPKENQEQHGDEEQRESMPVQSAYALRQGVQVSKDSDHERKEQDTAEGPQDEAERAWGAVTKQTDQEKASSKNQASGSTERQEESESSERNQQDDNVSASSTAGGQQQQTTAEPSRSSMEQEEAIRERRLHRGKVDCMPPFASLPSAPLQKLQTLPSQALPPNRFLTS